MNGVVAGKTKRNLFVEIDHEHLVLRVAGAGKRQGGGNHVMALRSHASTVVDDQADRDRDIFVAEILDRLKHSVFVDLEIVFGESGDQSAFVVQRGCVQDHHVHIYADGVSSPGGLGRRGFLRPGKRGGAIRDEKTQPDTREKCCRDCSFSRFARDVPARIRNAQHPSGPFSSSESGWKKREGAILRAVRHPVNSHVVFTLIHPLLSSDGSLRKSRESKAGAQRQQPDQSNQGQRAGGFRQRLGSSHWQTGAAAGGGSTTWASSTGSPVGATASTGAVFKASTGAAASSMESRARAHLFPWPTRGLSALRIQIPRPMHARGKTMPSELQAVRQAAR